MRPCPVERRRAGVAQHAIMSLLVSKQPSMPR
jgi:hypothetical protein